MPGNRPAARTSSCPPKPASNRRSIDLQASIRPCCHRCCRRLWSPAHPLRRFAAPSFQPPARRPHPARRRRARSRQARRSSRPRDRQGRGQLAKIGTEDAATPVPRVAVHRASGDRVQLHAHYMAGPDSFDHRGFDRSTRDRSAGRRSRQRAGRARARSKGRWRKRGQAR
jgi:hypothetical protein